MTTIRQCLIVAGCGLLLGSAGAESAWSADRAAIDQAVQKAVGFLRANRDQAGEGGAASLIGLALLKANLPHDSPELRGVAGAIEAKIKDGNYQPTSHHIYEAGTDASFLADLDAERYKPQIEAIGRYLVATQRPNGSWDYPTGRTGTNGDTSVTQYACLGLWSASRAGFEVPKEVWEKVLRWLLASQASDGGYAYAPGTTEGWYKGETNLNMAVAAAGAILIAGRELFPALADELYAGTLPSEEKPAEESPLLGVLQKVDLATAPPPTDQPVSPDVTIKPQDVRRALDRLRGYLSVRFRPVNDTPHFPYYYFYSVERMGALGNVTRIGQYDWYDACSSALLGLQTQDGSWTAVGATVRQHAAIDTSFAVLFLTRSTGKILKRAEPDPTYGGGLLTGGKGAPAEVVAARKDPTPLDQLLASLQNPGSLDLRTAQTELVEQIQLGDRSELVGQKETLIKLIQHPHGEVRRTAAWALGRTNDLSLARYLIDALEDPDLGVMIEAHAALCWLSRRFDGFGLPVNPLDELPETASEEEKQTAIRGWRVRARRDWGHWYLRVRPYADRGDEFEARLRQRLADR